MRLILIEPVPDTPHQETRLYQCETCKAFETTVAEY
jgi:hypothetical protein